jgi:hypothetical protein
LSFHRITGRLVFSNAGHLPPLWYHATQRSWGWLEEGNDPKIKKVAGLPVGLIPGTDYSQTVVTLNPSDLLVLYTDGITEAENGTRQELGREQFRDWARRAPVDSAKALGEDLLQRLDSFRGGIRNDDETLLVLRREEESRLVVLGEVASSYTFWPAASQCGHYGIWSTYAQPQIGISVLAICRYSVTTLWGYGERQCPPISICSLPKSRASIDQAPGPIIAKVAARIANMMEVQKSPACEKAIHI